jgi:hypothetical protein
MTFLDESVRRYHSDRVFESVEARDLQQERFVTRHAQLLKSSINLFGQQLTILFAKGVDGGIDQELWDRKPSRKLRERKDRCVISCNKRAQKMLD